MTWKFSEPPNMAVITFSAILDGSEEITFVSHDADDGSWQFLGSSEIDETNAMVVSLHSMVELDSTISELADLPLGWHARRESLSGQWQRGANL